MSISGKSLFPSRTTPNQHQHHYKVDRGARFPIPPSSESGGHLLTASGGNENSLRPTDSTLKKRYTELSTTYISNRGYADFLLILFLRF